jgi:segregation and condensation protein B
MVKKLIEAALFMASRPLDVKEISKMTGIASLGEIEGMLNGLKMEYEGRGMEILKTPEGWIMQVKQDMLPKVARFAKHSDLAEGHRRTLALVVYKEPVMQSEIIRIQGNKAYDYIKHLERKGLVKTEKKGRSRVVQTAQEFENYFGKDKEAIKERLEKTVRVLEQQGRGKQAPMTPDQTPSPPGMGQPPQPKAPTTTPPKLQPKTRIQEQTE